jgi:hypothetical protein
VADNFRLKAKINKQQIKNVVDRLGGIKNVMTQQVATTVGKAVVAEMKDMISKGISPVEETGRFPAYKHAGEKGKYPDSVRHKYPEKRQRPVNLYLSGAMLDALTFRVLAARNGNAVEVGYYDSDQAKKEEGHAIGWNGQPKRPTIPGPGQQFAVRIQAVVIQEIKKALSQYVKR